MNKISFIFFLLGMGIALYLCLPGVPPPVKPPQPPVRLSAFVFPSRDYDTSAAREIHGMVPAQYSSCVIENNKIVYGYKTGNRDIEKRILMPQVMRYYTELKSLSPEEVINSLTLLIFKTYREYIGKSFYRWGGDLYDIDNPQINGVRYRYRYGLDCSGFSTSGYELAVRSGLIDSASGYALFSSVGLERYSREHKFKLRGGVLGGNNNFRLDTSELAELGREIFHLNKRQKPSKEQIALLRPGDLVGRNGHFGVIIFIDGIPHYAESGGFVLSSHNYAPVPAEEALGIFASRMDISVRRAL